MNHRRLGYSLQDSINWAQRPLSAIPALRRYKGREMKTTSSKPRKTQQNQIELDPGSIQHELGNFLPNYSISSTLKTKLSYSITHRLLLKIHYDNVFKSQDNNQYHAKCISYFLYKHLKSINLSHITTLMLSVEINSNQFI